jgi:DNA invertase Pin-like site-specific DNA recombinase
VSDLAAIYARVSTVEQDLSGQEAELLAYLERRGWALFGVYREKVSASGKVEREQYDRLLADARSRSREFNRVVVWSLDRWSRDPSFVKAIGSIEELESLGVRFHSLHEPGLDSSEDGSANLGRDLLRGILPTIAAFEARRRSERTQVAMNEIKSGRRPTRSGRAPGRPRRVTPEMEARIRELRWGKKLPWKQVAQYVHLPAGTCSKVTRTPSTETPLSVKGQDGFGEPDGGRSDVQSPTRGA